MILVTIFLIALSCAMTMALAGCLMRQRNAIVPVILLMVGIVIFGAVLNF